MLYIAWQYSDVTDGSDYHLYVKPDSVIQSQIWNLITDSLPLTSQLFIKIFPFTHISVCMHMSVGTYKGQKKESDPWSLTYRLM